MKRVYATVAVEEDADGFLVRLDKRELRTPAGKPLRLPNQALAAALAAEWDAQTEEIRPHDMPLMQLTATALDVVGPQRETIIDGVAAYAGTDLVCYRAEYPASLVARQEATWGPLVAWVLTRYDAPLAVHAGVMPRPQPETTLAVLRRSIAAADDWRLTALQAATAAAGSVVIGLALLEGRLDAAAAFEAAELDGSFQIEKWGEDAEATARRARLRADLDAAHRFARLAA